MKCGHCERWEYMDDDHEKWLAGFCDNPKSHLHMMLLMNLHIACKHFKQRTTPRKWYPVRN